MLCVGVCKCVWCVGMFMQITENMFVLFVRLAMGLQPYLKENGFVNPAYQESQT